MVCIGYMSKFTSKRKGEMQCGHFFEFASTDTRLVVFDVTLHLQQAILHIIFPQLLEVYEQVNLT